MINLLKEINKEFRIVSPESFLVKNHKSKDKIIYPYITYSLDNESLEHGIDGFYLDVDIFDSNSSYASLFILEKQLRDHFRKKDIMLDDLFLRFNYLRSNNIDTLDELIKRRNLQFYIKVYWRDR